MKNTYHFSIWVALTASLLFLWLIRFPPMQDYPAHLMIAKVVSTAADGGYNWSEHYTVEPKYGPYSLSYNLLTFIAQYLSLEYAGKILISLYFIFSALFIIDCSRIYLAKGHTPWPMLLIFPLLYNQAYYLGFLNYLISIPLILWLIYDYLQIRDASERPRWRLWLQQLLPLILFLLHPFSLAIYCGLTLGILAYRRATNKQIYVENLTPLFWFAIITLWFAFFYIGNSTQAFSLSNSFIYWPVESNIHFLLLAITGNHDVWGSGVVLGVWAVIAYILLQSENKGTQPGFSVIIVMLLMSYLLLPFNVFGYSYFSQRIAPLLYIALIIYLSQKSIIRKHLLILLVSIVVLYYDIFQTHSGISAEIESELVPALAHIPKNSRIYAIYIDSASEYVNRDLYYQFHAHTHNYYHVLVGGGYSPGMIYNNMLPVKYKKDIPPLDGHIALTECGINNNTYDYVAFRGLMNNHIISTIPAKWQMISSYGSWHLYKIQPCS